MVQERRRYHRIPCSLPVDLRHRAGTTELLTANVGRHGAFVLTDSPARERELVQLKFRLGGFGDVDVMATVSWRVLPGEEAGAGRPGMGVAFFALSGPHKDRWDTFIRAMDEADDEVPQWAAPTRRRPRPVRRRHPRFVTCFLVQVRDVGRLRDLYTRDISAGGLFLRNPEPERLHRKVRLVLVHPGTHEELALDGKVVRVEADGPPEARGVAIAFTGLASGTESAVRAFIESGVNVLHRRDSLDFSRVAQMRRAVEMVYNDPEGLVVVARALLDASAPDVAREALERATALDPNNAQAAKLVARL